MTGTDFVGSQHRSDERRCFSASVLVSFSASVLVLVLGARDVAEALVQAGSVVPADVLDDRELELASGAPDAVCDQLGSRHGSGGSPFPILESRSPRNPVRLTSRCRAQVRRGI